MPAVDGLKYKLSAPTTHWLGDTEFRSSSVDVLTAEGWRMAGEVSTAVATGEVTIGHVRPAGRSTEPEAPAGPFPSEDAAVEAVVRTYQARMNSEA